MVDSQAAADRKDRHTIRGRKFRYVEDDVDEVNHRQSECLGVAGSSSCYYFDGLKGRRNGATVLVFGELSHFCEKCFAGEFAKDSEGRLTGTPDCDGRPDLYVYNEVIHVPNDAINEGKELLEQGSNEGAVGPGSRVLEGERRLPSRRGW